MEIEKKLLDVTDTKSIELADGDTSQEVRRTITNGSEGDELTSAPIEKSDDVPVKEVVDMCNLMKVHMELVK